MLRRMMTTAAVSAAVLLGAAGTGSAVAGATTPIPLLLPQGAAFSVLGHSCGGIQEQAFATGFDATSGYPVGDVYLKTTCSTGGRGSRPATFTAWTGVTWDFTGAVVLYGVLTGAPSVDPAFSAFDGYGNEVYNASNAAFLSLAPTFVPAPRVTGLSVTAGPASGGTSVTITGTGFTGATSVDFGGAAGTFTVTGDTSIAAVSPATGAGTVDVTVTTAGGPSASNPSDQFTFLAAPTVTGLSPTSGPTTGGTVVTVTGLSFTGATSVTFGGIATGFTVNSDTSITAVAPVAEASGLVPVKVVSLGGTSAVSTADRFTYTPAQTVVVAPTAGPPATPVTASGAGFSPGESVTVTYATGLSAPSPTSVHVCTGVAASDGTFSCHGNVPGTGTAGAVGAHKIKAKGLTSLVQASTTFKLS